MVSKAAFILLVILIPLFAQAKIISLVSSLFASEKQDTEVSSLNSQRMSILEAPLSPFPSVGGGDITVVDGEALIADTGPAGNQADFLKESGQISVYVVREGDSLSQIAGMFDVSVNTIKWANDIKSNTISPGQTLVILPISGVRHTVKKGDTLDKIASLYKGEVEEVLAYNGLSKDSKLAVGQIVTVPGGTIQSASQPKASSPSSSSSRPSTSQPVYEGYYMKPIVGGYRSQGIHGYNAVDLAAPSGTPILAAANGVVTVSRNAGWNGGYGNYVVISHPNGTQTLYAHLNQAIVSTGQSISQGDTLGYVGSTGRSSGPHLHFEVRGARNPF